MSTHAATPAYTARRDPRMKVAATLAMTVAIALVGAIMMTISSSPTVKGASFLWLPAALQLTAGVWLGPWYGLVAGGLGAYLAGGLSYGGWGSVDIVQNLIAGGVANAMLPGLLFRWFKIDPTLGATKPSAVLSSAARVLILVGLVLGAGLLNMTLKFADPWGYLIPLVVLFVGWRWLLSDMPLDMKHFLPALVVAVVICAVSAFIGALGATMTDKPLSAALVDPGLGWFIGDTVSAILGLFLLALFTQRMKDAGIAE